MVLFSWSLINKRKELLDKAQKLAPKYTKSEIIEEALIEYVDRHNKSNFLEMSPYEFLKPRHYWRKYCDIINYEDYRTLGSLIDEIKHLHYIQRERFSNTQ